MPRPASPWFRTSANAWYVTLNGRKVSLGVQGKKNEKAAVDAWHRLMATGSPAGTPSASPQAFGQAKPMAEPKPKSASVSDVVAGFLADTEARVTPGCQRNYRLHLDAFADAFGKHDADTVKASDVEAYARKPEWSPSYRNGVISSIVSAFRWAERAGLLANDALRHVRKPPKASRGAKALVSADVHARLCAVAREPFRSFLQLLWLTGARPGEIAALTAEAIDMRQGVAILAEHKCAHLGKSRAIFLCADALAVIRSLDVPQGLLFPTRQGKPMSIQDIGTRLTRLCRKAKVAHVIPYGYRHSFCTDALSKGIPDAHVAALMGHSSTSMLHRHYSHLTARAGILRKALAEVR